MSFNYDDWKTDPEYDERIRERGRIEREEEAIRKGYGEYSNPAEAYMCARCNTTFKGLHYGEPFEGIPERDY